MEKVKDYVNANENSIKTHIIVNGTDTGISHFSGKELIEKYGECECETITYEKEFGFDEEDKPIIALISYLAIYIKNQE